MTAKKPLAGRPVSKPSAPKEKTAQELALEQIKSVYDDGKAKINGTEYVFGDFVHKQRRKVFSFYSTTAKEIENQDFSFLDEEKFDEIEALICQNTLVDNLQISKSPQFWDNHAGDYMAFVILAMQVISYPFMQGGNGE